MCQDVVDWLSGISVYPLIPDIVLTYRVFKLIHLKVIVEEFQFLLFHRNGRHHVFVLQVGRDPKVLTENVEGTATADKPDQMITA